MPFYATGFHLDEERKDGKTGQGFDGWLACVVFLCFLLANKLKVTPRLIPFLFSDRPCVSDFSMLNQQLQW